MFSNPMGQHFFTTDLDPVDEWYFQPPATDGNREFLLLGGRTHKASLVLEDATTQLIDRILHAVAHAHWENSVVAEWNWAERKRWRAADWFFTTLRTVPECFFLEVTEQPGLSLLARIRGISLDFDSEVWASIPSRGLESGTFPSPFLHLRGSGR